MTALSRLLCRSFSTSLRPKTYDPVKAISDDLYSERSFKRLVEKFKKSSEFDRFRTKTGIYEDTVRRLASAKRFQSIEEILEDQKKYADMSKEGFAVRIIALYGKSGMFDQAQKVFDEMPDFKCDRTVLSLNAILSACVNSKKFDKFEGLFRELPGKLSVEPDSISYNIAIKGFCEKGSFEAAISLLDEMEKKGLKPDLVSFNTLISELNGNGKFDDAEKIWSRMEEKNVIPNVRSYNAKLIGLSSQGKTTEALEIFNEMKSKGIKPDIFSYNNVLKGFIVDENLEGAKTWYQEIGKSEFDPTKATFNMFLPFICKKGDVGFAFALCEEIFNIKCFVHNAHLQRVVNDLVKESKIEEAKKLVELGKRNKYRNFGLQLPESK